MFLPWATVPAMGAINGFMNRLGMGSGAGSDYNIPALGEPVDNLTHLVGSNSLKVIHTLFLVVWIAVLVLLVAGLISSFIGKRKSALLTLGCVAIVITGLAWACTVAMINASNNYEILTVAGGCVGAIVVGAVTAVLLIAGRQHA